MSASKYARDPSYGKPPKWSKLYAEHCPQRTDGCSRHVKLIAEQILRKTNSPVRKLLIDAGYEPDHWAESMEITVRMLWEARRWLRYDADAQEWVPDMAEIARLSPERVAGEG